MNYKKLKAQEGFSLIELMVVIVIIGILSSIAVPNFQKFQLKAKRAEAKANLAALYAAEQAFKSEFAQYFAGLPDVGFEVAGTVGYDVGFLAGGILAPSNHPSLVRTERGNARRRLSQVCPTQAAATATSTCVQNADTFRSLAGGGGGGGGIAVATFCARAASNIERSDTALDVMMMNHTKTYFQAVDDIDRNNAAGNAAKRPPGC